MQAGNLTRWRRWMMVPAGLVILALVLIVTWGMTWQALPAEAGESASLTELVRSTMAAYFEHPAGSTASYSGLIRKWSARLNAKQPHANRPAGVFVTLSHEGHSRACWGSVYPRYKTVTESTVYATLGALTKEYRYPPIRRDEWQSLKPQVTVIQALEPITSVRGLNPLRDGLLVRAGGRAGVILPGEARDAVYQLVQGRLKAGIQPHESYQLYRIVADVYQ